MRFPFKALMPAILAIAVLLATAYISCNKDNNTKSTTVIKCVSCANGGNCINDTCRCPAGWEGTTCQTQSRQKYFGQWQAVEKGSLSTGTAQYVFDINELPSSINAVEVGGLYADSLFSFYTLDCNINGDSIFIPSQQIQNFVFVGRGFINPTAVSPLSGTGEQGIITMRYQVTNINTGLVNDFGYSSAVDSPSVWFRD